MEKYQYFNVMLLFFTNYHHIRYITLTLARTCCLARLTKRTLKTISYYWVRLTVFPQFDWNTVIPHLDIFRIRIITFFVIYWENKSLFPISHWHFYLIPHGIVNALTCVILLRARAVVARCKLYGLTRACSTAVCRGRVLTLPVPHGSSGAARGRTAAPRRP